MAITTFIVRKFIFSRKDSRFINLISVISIVGIALGVSTLIIALSVLEGFEKTITEKIVQFDSHIKITSFRGSLNNSEKTLNKLNSDLKKYSPTITPFASKLVIVSSKKTKDGLNLIGIDHSSQQPGLTRNIVSGKFDLTDKTQNIIIGKKIADKLFLNVGDKVTIFALDNDKLPSPENLPSIERFSVAGIFESGMAKYDDTYAYVSLNNARKLLGIGNSITGYDIKLGDISKIDSLTSYLARTLRYPHHVRSIYQIHRNIFTWIQLQKEPIPIVLALIILVAVFNIIGTLLMIVLEKTNSVGVLKSLGAKRKQITGIFLSQGIVFALTGILLGNIIAILLMEVQTHFDIIKIPSDVYFMSKVPLVLTFDNILLVSFVTLLLSISASVIPSFIASRIKPISALRFS